MDKLLVSFSGGRTSAYMMKWCFDNFAERYEMKFVFANTGKEHTGTLDFVEKCSIEWGIPIVWVESKHLSENGMRYSTKGWKVSHRIVNRSTASTSGAPFEEMISVIGIPSTKAPFCSDQLKRKPIESYMKEIGWSNYYKAIGIRIDEVDRVNPRYKENKIIYPLITDAPMTKKQIMGYWDKNGFDLNCPESMGNCDNCWKKSIKVLSRNMNLFPKTFDWWSDMEEKYQGVRDVSAKGGRTFFFRKGSSIDDIRRYANLSSKQRELFDNDIVTDRQCEGSCEVF